MFASIIAAAGMCADGVAEGLYATRHRFAARATSAGYAIGAALAWIFGLVTPITFTVESITVATRTATTRPQILYIVALSAIPSIFLGAFGLYSTIIDLLSEAVIGGVIAGVGIILAGVGVGYIRERPLTAGSSTAAGFLSYLVTGNLVVVIVAAVVVGTAVSHLTPRSMKERLGETEKDDGEGQDGGQDTEEEAEGEDQEPRVGFVHFDPKMLVARSVLLGALSLFALRIGAVVSYDTVNADLAGDDPSFDPVMLMAGLGSLASAILGGPPLETTPAPMAEAPMPVFSTGLFMAFMAVVTLLGLVAVLGKFVPLQAIAGFLIVLGIPVIMPENLPIAVEDPIPGGTALAITALSNPFYGIAAGQVVRILIAAGLDQGVS